MDRKHTIAYLVRPAEGGIKTHLLTLLQGLDRTHFTPIVICPENSPLASAVKEMGVDVIPLEIVDGLHPLKDVQAALALRKILHKLKPEILHIHSAKAGLVGRLAVRTKRRPKVVLTMHSFVCDERMGEQRKRLYARMERYFAKVTDQIITVSQALKDELVSEIGLPASLITVIYNGLAFRKAPKVPHGGVRIGTIARLAPQKGVENFIRAAALVLMKHPEVSFGIVGDGPLKRSLSDLARSLSIYEEVDLLGARADVSAFLGELDLFVLTSTREAFGITVTEALAQEIPVVATRVGGIPEIIDGKTTGLLAESNNPQDIADKICQMLDDREAAQQMARAGNEFIRTRFTAVQMLEETQAVYYDLLDRRRRIRA